MLSAAALAWPLSGLAQQPSGKGTGHRPRPMTASEEAAAALAVAESIADQTGETVHPAVGRMPRFPRPFATFDGIKYSESRARGKLLVVYQWASWCPVCKLVSPRLQEFWARNRDAGVEVLALSVDSDPLAALASFRRSGFGFPTAMASEARLEEYMTARSLPTLMVRSRRGVIVGVDEGDVEAEELQDYLVHL